MRRAAMLIASLLLASAQAAVASEASSSAFDFRVQVGAVPQDGATLPFSYTRFYPETLRVHPGQTVLFDTVEAVDLHSVSFWPGDGSPHPPLFRMNEYPERFAVNELRWRRSACGEDAEAACILDGSEYRTSGLRSGVPVLYGTTWRVRLDLPPGTTAPFFCMVHPGMKGSIEVVDDSVTLPTQDQLDEQTGEQVASDTQEAIEHQAMRDAQVLHRTEDGREVWRVLVGDSTPSEHVSIMAYMPTQLPAIQPGDAVEFVSSGIGHHSVTFPTALVGHKGASAESRLASGAIHPTCDLDAESDAPDIPGLWAPFSPLACPGTFELVLSPWLADQHPAPGNLVATPLTYHDSGLMWSEQAPENARARPDGGGNFPHSFLAEFPVARTFAFACTVHGAEHMAGTVQVG